MEFPVKEIEATLGELKALEEEQEKYTEDGRIVDFAKFFITQSRINKKNTEVYEIFENWANSNDKDPDSVDVFFLFSCKTGLHENSEIEFFISKKKEENEKISYLLGVVDETSEDEDEDIWINEETLQECYPHLIKGLVKNIII